MAKIEKKKTENKIEKKIKDKLNDNLNDLIKEKKEQNKKLTQAQQAMEMGIPESNLSKYVNGEVVPRADAIYIMAEYYNCSADYLLGLSKKRTADINEAKMSDELGLSEKAIKTLKKWKKNSIPGENIVFMLNYLFDLDYLKYLLLSLHRYIYGDIKRFNIEIKQSVNNKKQNDVYIVENQAKSNESEILIQCENYTNKLDVEYINRIHELELYNRIQKIKENILDNIKKFPNKLKNFHFHGFQ